MVLGIGVVRSCAVIECTSANTDNRPLSAARAGADAALGTDVQDSDAATVNSKAVVFTTIRHTDELAVFILTNSLFFLRSILAILVQSVKRGILPYLIYLNIF
jgi:hypothetical protein